MAKTLRIRTRAGWVTKPAPDSPENRLTSGEIDDNFLSLEDVSSGLRALADKRHRDAFRKEKSTSIAPSLLLDFEADKELDPGITFSRASTATFYGPNGVLQTAAAGVPRFDHNPITGESLGLLIEEQRTNLAIRSEDFDNADWTKFNEDVTANDAVAPDGTQTGDLIAPLVTGSTLNVRRTASVTSGQAYTLTVYAKAYTASLFQMALLQFGFTFSTGVRADFNLATGVATLVNTGGATVASGAASMTLVGNGWYRCVLTGTTAFTGTLRYDVLNISTTEAVAGQGVFLWGAQLEAGAFPTSYIKTVASQVTRSGDLPDMTGANFSSWFRPDQGTLYAEAIPAVSNYGAARYIASLGDGTTNNFIAQRYSTAGTIQAIVFAGSQQALFAGGSHPVNVPFKSALAYQVNSAAISKDGAAVATGSPAIIPVVNQLLIGRLIPAGNIATQHIRKLAYYPKRLSNTELQALTS